jgi:hypothetical protein
VPVSDPFPNPAERCAFDKASQFAFTAFLNTCEYARTLLKRGANLLKVSQGEIAHIRETTIQIDENIDKHLRKQLEVEGVLNTGENAQTRDAERNHGAPTRYWVPVPKGRSIRQKALLLWPLMPLLSQSISD